MHGARDRDLASMTAFKGVRFMRVVATWTLCVGLQLILSGGPCWGETKVEKVEYKGWKNNLKLSNGTVELIATLDVGPRIIRYAHVGGENVLKEYADQLGK